MMISAYSTQQERVLSLLKQQGMARLSEFTRQGITPATWRACARRA
jgi:hypothetical protein